MSPPAGGCRSASVDSPRPRALREDPGADLDDAGRARDAGEDVVDQGVLWDSADQQTTTGSPGSTGGESGPGRRRRDVLSPPSRRASQPQPKPQPKPRPQPGGGPSKGGGLPSFMYPGRPGNRFQRTAPGRPPARGGGVSTPSARLGGSTPSSA
ncbi:unnamed protein product, partial [Ectocarpus sp. 8 AP-2014]